MSFIKTSNICLLGFRYSYLNYTKSNLIMTENVAKTKMLYLPDCHPHPLMTPENLFYLFKKKKLGTVTKIVYIESRFVLPKHTGSRGCVIYFEPEMTSLSYNGFVTALSIYGQTLMYFSLSNQPSMPYLVYPVENENSFLNNFNTFSYGFKSNNGVMVSELEHKSKHWNILERRTDPLSSITDWMDEFADQNGKPTYLYDDFVNYYGSHFAPLIWEAGNTWFASPFPKKGTIHFKSIVPNPASDSNRQMLINDILIKIGNLCDLTVEWNKQKIPNDSSKLIFITKFEYIPVIDFDGTVSKAETVRYRLIRSYVQNLLPIAKTQDRFAHVIFISNE